MIEVEHLRKIYNEIAAVDDATFTAHAGEIFGLLGPNGAGKTTTIGCISGLLTPTAGKVLVDSHDVVRDGTAARRSIGIVPQELALYDDLSATENLEYWGGAQGLRGPQLKQRVAKVLELTGLQDRAKETVKRYSGGMKRRLNFACGLIHQPKVLLLDEPTVGVDPQSRVRLLDLVREEASPAHACSTAFQQAIPGIMVQFILLVMFTTGGLTLYQERTRGILRRLASSPMPRSSVVLGKALSRLTIGLLQIAFAMIVGPVLFKVDWGPHVIAVMSVLCTYAVLAALAGMILGNFAKSEGQIIAIGVILANALAAIGGCWWPIEITPEWAQKASLATPTGWAMGAMHKLVSFGASPLSALPHLLALAAAAACAAYVISRSFRFQ